MFSFKQPLAQHQNCMLSGRAMMPGSVATDQQMLADAAQQICAEIYQTAGIRVVSTVAPIQIGGFFNKKTLAGIHFTFPDRPQYATVLLGCSRIANMLNVDVILAGTPSKAWQNRNLANYHKQQTGLGSMVAGAVRSAMTDTAALEEEEAYYGVVLQFIQEKLDLQPMS